MRDTLSSILDQIKKANDIKEIEAADYRVLAKEIRRFLLLNVSKTGGHLASNLGVVELTMALHLSSNLPEDKLVWDVGHQAYTHKILTGRQKGFSSLRQYKGLCGFPRTSESKADSFNTGHSSTSISLALGMAKARDIKGEKNKVTAVIGDGALTGGLALEALNNAGRVKSNLVIVLNDNNMSISENVGGMANYLGKLRTDVKYYNLKQNVEKILNRLPAGDSAIGTIKKSKDSIKRLFIPGMFFEDIGLTYIGPIDGHDIYEMLKALKSAYKAKGAVIVHVKTKKGKGYKLAEKQPEKFHGVSPFHLKTGESRSQKNASSYTDVFSKTLTKLGEENNKIVAISAAMPNGTGAENFKEEFPERFIDVGIAEEHGVTFAAGLAKSGMRPVVAIYSTFLQRAYDQILHDVCIDNLPVIFAIDRAGIVGKDGETHQGLFDLSFLSHMPNMTVMAPKNKFELEDMLYFASKHMGPIAIRYPRGNAYEGLKEFNQVIEYGKSEILYEEQDSTILILALGSMVESALEVYSMLSNSGIKSTLVNVRFVSPLDNELLHLYAKRCNTWVTLEENVKAGGFGEKISSFLTEHNYKDIQQINISIPDCFVEQGSPEELKQQFGLDSKSIHEKITNNFLQFNCMKR
ncbi:MAG TPA: 1-deoxy-D-xylulose-5-phosphate synthase [Clostridiales bacterium]|nr:1-deoxy-D-xylulose-5-phosphate synthase [Clostridiales bacterium]